MFTKIVMCVLAGARCKLGLSPYENKTLLFAVHEVSLHGFLVRTLHLLQLSTLCPLIQESRETQVLYKTVIQLGKALAEMEFRSA